MLKGIKSIKSIKSTKGITRFKTLDTRDTSGTRGTFSSGFTLIEVLISAALMVILSAGFLGLQFIMSQNQVSAWRNYLSIESANAAITNLTRELRDTRQSDTGAYPLEVTNDAEIIFYSDIDYDEDVERVRYTLTGSDLVKGVVEPTGDPISYPQTAEKVRVISDIVRNGANPLFYYYNADWPIDTTNNPLAAASRIAETRQIKIVIITNTDPDLTENDYTLESYVRLRMLN